MASGRGSLSLVDSGLGYARSFWRVCTRERVPMKNRLLCVFAILALVPFQASASASPKAIAVLDQEQRWLKAVAKGDANALAAILAENFVHINARGELIYREDTLAEVKKPKPYMEHTSEQTVDFVGAAAVVHGVNTVTQAGKTVRLRYTDIYEQRSGRWMAISAQETTML